jgi:hypothetical protein
VECYPKFWPIRGHLNFCFDLAPADISSFPKLEIMMKATRFEAMSSIQQAVMRERMAICEGTFLAH